MTWLIIVAIVVVLVVGAVAVLQKRSAAVRDRFGPEYERLVEERGDRRAVESELRERAKRHDALELHDLPEETREAYAIEWTTVQAGFVDDPGGTVARADALVARAMRDRGYPVDEWEERHEMVSVDHPELAENYRVAHAIHERAGTEEVDIDDLREAFQRYRSLFTELLEDGTPDPDYDAGDRDDGEVVDERADDGQEREAAAERDDTEAARGERP